MAKLDGTYFVIHQSVDRILLQEDVGGLGFGKLYSITGEYVEGGDYVNIIISELQAKPIK